MTLPPPWAPAVTIRPPMAGLLTARPERQIGDAFATISTPSPSVSSMFWQDLDS
jgi:hypothetical protein